MSTPRTKRQFAGAAADPSQRQITSFFNKSGGTTAHAADATPVRQPELPSSVQANLLSVGMRVRKSVPEGYKTVGPSAFKLWTDNAPVATKSSIVRSPAKASTTRELLPFCGINSVGGLASQPAFEHDGDEVPELDSVPELTMSQESTDSAESSFVDSYESSRKRIFDEDEDQVDKRTLIPGSSTNSRVMAVPHSRVKKVPLRSTGQENKSGSDFEDAEFLVFDEGEMDMGH